MGLAPPTGQDGDVICILAGGEVPHVLRAIEDGYYKMIGEWANVEISISNYLLQFNVCLVRLIWRAVTDDLKQGDTGGNFTLDPNVHFTWQHDARLTPLVPTTTALTYFSNYNNFGTLNGTHPSEGLTFNLGFDTFSATLAQNFSGPN
ncbi:hypothetical protein G7Y89_g2324 [Cudoniella acicularis]|uniref:Uncharacterized protein n=1 Tax=Cudoniella acicularis TaxID=354080 RepID=A0A8H4W6L5_9HELO|nr:hypothetical protein G7Y89_g2324 [Cudoniella acicularis]